MLFDLLGRWQPFVVLFSITFFLIWETLSPFFRMARRFRHAGINLLIAGVNAAILSLAFSGLLVTASVFAEARGLGVFRWAGISGPVLVIASFLAIDIWTYWWHRLNHRVPLLWRLHRMHHSDPAVDVTTATRFHFGEIALSSLARLVLIPLFGIPIEAVILFDVVQLPIIAFHHANISLPEKADSLLCLILVTPFMHKVHHSRRKQETDSNYSSVLSLWDRVFGSFRWVEDHRSIRFGLDGFDRPERQSVAGLLRTPSTRRGRASR